MCLSPSSPRGSRTSSDGLVGATALPPSYFTTTITPSLLHRGSSRVTPSVLSISVVVFSLSWTRSPVSAPPTRSGTWMMAALLVPPPFSSRPGRSSRAGVLVSASSSTLPSASGLGWTRLALHLAPSLPPPLSLWSPLRTFRCWVSLSVLSLSVLLSWPAASCPLRER